jgi:two-component system chemotaxis response regulator CheB
MESSMSLTHESLPPIRVLIADDNAVMRTTLAHMLKASPQIRVCGTARNGQEVVEKTKLLQPEVITLDVEMPLLNRVEALKRIMSECPCPVIMFSSATREGAEVTLEALSAGAFDYLPKVSFKPCANTLKLQHDLVEKTEVASHSYLSRKALHRPPLPPPVPRIHSGMHLSQFRELWCSALLLEVRRRSRGCCPNYRATGRWP